MPDYTRQPSFDSTRVYRPEEVIALIKDIAPAFKPGSGVTSGDTDFFLLGLVVEAASGATYEAYVTEQQIKRLGLKNIYVHLRLGQPSPRRHRPGRQAR